MDMYRNAFQVQKHDLVHYTGFPYDLATVSKKIFFEDVLSPIEKATLNQVLN